MKTETMIKAINDRLAQMNEEGIAALYEILSLIPDREMWQKTTSPERVAELKQIKEKEEEAEVAKKKQEQQEKAAEDAKFLERNKALFDRIDAFDVPEEYDLTTGELATIDRRRGQISRYFPEYAFYISGDYFSLGFQKGMEYANAKK